MSATFLFVFTATNLDKVAFICNYNRVHKSNMTDSALPPRKLLSGKYNPIAVKKWGESRVAANDFPEKMACFWLMIPQKEHWWFKMPFVEKMLHFLIH
ncbi:hypothetical protein [Parapedobacter luteus]|nr:hypothetical protein [Parapedobacter luteus]